MNEELSHTSSTLLRNAKANNADAWEQLVRLYSRTIYRWCRRSGLQSADAGNVTQEVLRSVARKLPDFHKPEQRVGSFRGWLKRITTNKINDHFRGEAKRPSRGLGGTDAHRYLTHLESPPTTEATWATSPAERDAAPQIDPMLLEEVKGQFSERDWRMFWRVVVDGQSAVEVGEEFGVTANTVRIVKTRLLSKLRAKLATYNPSADKPAASDPPFIPK